MTQREFLEILYTEYKVNREEDNYKLIVALDHMFFEVEEVMIDNEHKAIILKKKPETPYLAML